MGKKFIFLLFLALLCQKSKAMHLDSMHGILYQAFISETDSQAIVYFNKASKLIEDDSSIAYYNYFKYYYFYRKNNKDSTYFYHNKAVNQLYKTKLYSEFFKLRNNLFWSLVDESKYDEAVVEINKNIQFAKDLKDTVRLIDFYSHLGVVYHDIAEYEKGIKMAKKGLLVSKNPKFNESLGHCYNAIGICFDDAGIYDSAIYYHRINLSILDKEGNYYVQTLNNLGNTYFKKNELDSAKKYIYIALTSKENNDYSLATSLNNYADILMRQKNYSEAKNYLDSALYYANSSNSNEKKRDIYSNLHEYHKAQGNYKEALSYLGLYHGFKDSMLNNERVSIINNLEHKAKEAALSEKVSKAEASTNLRNLWIVIVGASLLITLLFARQLYLKRKQAAEEAKLKLQNERLRISRDLHDNLGAELTYISSIIDQKAYDMKDPEKRAELENISNSSRHAMDQMRETIWAIKTDEISVSKFIQKVKNTSAKYAKAASMELDIRTSGDNVLMPPSKVIVLFRVCQESINNAVKYSHGNKISIEMNVEDNAYTIQISDDGKGFDIQNVKKGYGLNNIGERMAEIAGNFKIDSIIDKGTTLTLMGPLIT